jgi:hypothetical protein
MSAVGTKLTPKKRAAFLAELARTGNVTLAAQEAKVHRTHVYQWRESDPDFAVAWDAALDQAADLLEEEARRRAYEGVPRLKFNRGKPIMVPVVGADGLTVRDKDGNVEMVPYIEHEYSDTLLIFLLKGIRPEKYRERSEVKHTEEPVPWERVPPDVRDAFIDGKVSLGDVRRLLTT